jgi:site-specific DNA-methyltransferase (adenine-specific)
MTWNIINGDNREVLKQFPDNHFDAIVTDPPYGIDFLGKDWDADTGSIETYRECFRVLKPGGHILAFSAARTYHHLAVSIERAGFEIRDQIMWIYSSGFPKSQDVGRSIQRQLGVKETKKNPNTRTTKGDSLYEGGHQKATAGDSVVCTDEVAKQWAGWGTQLKPGHEPICMARKPMKDSVAKNVQVWGTGAINIDATRVEGEPRTVPVASEDAREDKTMFGLNPTTHHNREVTSEGRFPANVIGDIPEYQKFFYQPKVSKKERNVGCETIEPKVCINDGREKTVDNAFQRGANLTNNNHPTVKPVELMKYLIKLVTAPGGKVLDPFNGSGSTGMAAVELGFDYTGIELDPAYVDIANKRIEAWNQKHNLPGHLFK